MLSLDLRAKIMLRPLHLGRRSMNVTPYFPTHMSTHDATLRACSIYSAGLFVQRLLEIWASERHEAVYKNVKKQDGRQWGWPCKKILRSPWWLSKIKIIGLFVTKIASLVWITGDNSALPNSCILIAFTHSCRVW